jgi:hypothetical protein
LASLRSHDGCDRADAAPWHTVKSPANV